MGGEGCVRGGLWEGRVGVVNECKRWVIYRKRRRWWHVSKCEVAFMPHLIKRM